VDTILVGLLVLVVTAKKKKKDLESAVNSRRCVSCDPFAECPMCEEGDELGVVLGFGHRERSTNGQFLRVRKKWLAEESVRFLDERGHDEVRRTGPSIIHLGEFAGGSDGQTGIEAFKGQSGIQHSQSDGY
jgi:hypothetical protein